jgi:predicted Zn-dependent protease
MKLLLIALSIFLCIISSIIAETEINPEEVSYYENLLKSNPTDFESRSKLLTFYFTAHDDPVAQRARIDHIFWVIANRPESEIAGMPYCMLNPISEGSSYNEAKKLWMQQIEKYPKNTAVLANAAQYLLLYDRNEAEKILIDLQAMEPTNPEWYDQLSQLYSLETIHANDDSGRSSAIKALNQKERAFSLLKTEDEKFYALSDLATLAFEAGMIEKAEAHAKQLLNSAKSFPDDWNYGNAIHDANTVLGRIALKRDDVSKAEQHLLTSARIAGSPQLNSFGPSMDLARELLEKGRAKVVAEYLEECKKFWEMGQKNLDYWINDIRTKGTTDFAQHYN